MGSAAFGIIEKAASKHIHMEGSLGGFACLAAMVDDI